MDFKFDIPLQIQVVFYNLYFFTIKYSIARYKLESSVSMILRVDFLIPSPIASIIMQLAAKIFIPSSDR